MTGFREVVHNQQHRDLARKAAREALVLLKNENGILPLKKDMKNLYILGPYAASQDILLGNYNGISGNLTSILEGIMRKLNPATSVNYRIGTLADKENVNSMDWTTGEAQGCDVIIAVMGISGIDEGEEGDSLVATVSVTNNGPKDGDEVVQLYLTDRSHANQSPLFSLKSFRRIHLASGKSSVVTFMVSPPPHSPKLSLRIISKLP